MPSSPTTYDKTYETEVEILINAAFPRPWRVEENGLAGYGDNGRNLFIYAADDELVAEMAIEEPGIEGGPLLEAYRRAAHKIVKAVNEANARDC